MVKLRVNSIGLNTQEFDLFQLAKHRIRDDLKGDDAKSKKEEEKRIFLNSSGHLKGAD